MFSYHSSKFRKTQLGLWSRLYWILIWPDIRPLICRIPDIRRNSKYRFFSKKEIKKFLVFNKTYQHIRYNLKYSSIFHSIWLCMLFSLQKSPGAPAIRPRQHKLTFSLKINVKDIMINACFNFRVCRVSSHAYVRTTCRKLKVESHK